MTCVHSWVFVHYKKPPRAQLGHNREKESTDGVVMVFPHPQHGQTNPKAGISIEVWALSVRRQGAHHASLVVVGGEALASLVSATLDLGRGRYGFGGALGLFAASARTTPSIRERRPMAQRRLDARVA